MKRITSKTLSLALVLILGFSAMGPTLTAYAAENIDDQYTPITAEMAYTFAEMADIASKCTDVTDPHEIEQYTTIAASLVNDDSVIVNAGKNNLDYNTVHVLKGEFDNKSYTFCNIAINGGYSKLSNLNLIFDDNNHLIFYSETLLENNAEINKFIVNNYQNGVLIEQKQTDIDYISDEQISAGIEGLKNAAYEEETRGWGEKLAVWLLFLV